MGRFSACNPERLQTPLDSLFDEVLVRYATMKAFLTSVGVILCLAASSYAQGWRGIRPLHSTRADLAKDYLTEKRGINPKRIVIIDGGHRDPAGVDLYIILSGQPKPLASPNVYPGNVQIIKDSNASQPQSSQSRTYTVDSWKDGPTTVKEQTLRFNLKKLRKQSVRKIVKDSSGQPKYELKISSRERIDHASVFQAWNVQLVELGKKDASNLLGPEIPQSQDEYVPEQHVSLLVYQSDALKRELPILSVPFTSKRIIKVESFYCIIEPQKLDFSQNGRTLRSGELSIRLINNAPIAIARLVTTLSRQQRPY